MDIAKTVFIPTIGLYEINKRVILPTVVPAAEKLAIALGQSEEDAEWETKEFNKMIDPYIKFFDDLEMQLIGVIADVFGVKDIKDQLWKLG